MNVEEIAKAWGKAALGNPTEPEVVNPDKVGSRRAFELGIVYHHSERDVGGFVPFGPAWEVWRAYGYERGRLGYPVNAEPPRRGGWPALGRNRQRFEHGSIWYPQELRSASLGLKVVWLNTALMIEPFYKVHNDREQHVQRLIEVLKGGDWDVICLGEVYYASEQDEIVSSLRDSHPYVHLGPDETDLEQDGGLMILSRLPLLSRGQSIFRHCAGEDCLSNKGVLHARVRAASHPSLGSYPGHVRPFSVDIFATHMQAGPMLPIGDATSARRRQARHVASYVEAVSGRQRPAVLVGDFNMRFDEDPTWNQLLGSPRDAYLIANRGVDNPEATTSSGSARIDATLIYQSYGDVLLPSEASVVRFTLAEGDSKPLSDHQGIEVAFRPPVPISVDVHYPHDRKPTEINCSIATAHALDTTSGPGDDDVEVWFGGPDGTSDRTALGDFSSGQRKEFGPARVRLNARADESLRFKIRAEEEDRPWSGPERIGTADTEIPLEFFWLMTSDYSLRTPHPFPLLTGEGSQYAFTVRPDGAGWLR